MSNIDVRFFVETIFYAVLWQEKICF